MLDKQGLSFYTYLAKLEKVDTPVDGATIVMMSAFLRRNITVIG